jgi:hypothetical protein
MPQAEWNVYVSDCGSREARTGSLEKDLAFDQWSVDACEHESGVLLHHYIGNIAAVSLLREVLSPYPEAFKITLSKIIYSGTHCGDFIAADQVSGLKPELEALSELHSDDALSEEWIRHFESQLRELVETALKTGKPISF